MEHHVWCDVIYELQLVYVNMMYSDYNGHLALFWEVIFRSGENNENRGMTRIMSIRCKCLSNLSIFWYFVLRFLYAALGLMPFILNQTAEFLINRSLLWIEIDVLCVTAIWLSTSESKTKSDRDSRQLPERRISEQSPSLAECRNGPGKMLLKTERDQREDDRCVLSRAEVNSARTWIDSAIAQCSARCPFAVQILRNFQ